MSYVLCIHHVVSLSSPGDGPRDSMRPLIFRRVRRAISFPLSSSGEGRAGGERRAPKMLPRPQMQPVHGLFLGRGVSEVTFNNPQKII